MQSLSETEQKTLELLARNPFIGQSEIAEKLGLARSTVAVQIAQLISKGHILGRGYILPQSQKITCVGGIAFNRKYTLDASYVLGTSNPAKSINSHGGVVRNIAENLARLDVNVSLVSIVGDDDSGKELLSYMRNLGTDVSQVSVSTTSPTAEYVAVFDNENELILGLSNMEIIEQIDQAQIGRSWSYMNSSDWVILDCNLPKETIAFTLDHKQTAGFKIAVDTVSVSKAKRLPYDLSNIDLLFTNKAEAASMLQENLGIKEKTLEELADLLRARGANEVFITDGSNGHLVSTSEDQFRVPALSTNVINVSGAGDALVAGVLYKLTTGATLRESSQVGAALSALTVESDLDVRRDLCADSLDTYITETL